MLEQLYDSQHVILHRMKFSITPTIFQWEKCRQGSERFGIFDLQDNFVYLTGKLPTQDFTLLVSICICVVRSVSIQRCIELLLIFAGVSQRHSTWTCARSHATFTTTLPTDKKCLTVFACKSFYTEMLLVAGSCFERFCRQVCISVIPGSAVSVRKTVMSFSHCFAEPIMSAYFRVCQINPFSLNVLNMLRCSCWIKSPLWASFDFVEKYCDVVNRCCNRWRRRSDLLVLRRRPSEFSSRRWPVGGARQILPGVSS